MRAAIKERLELEKSDASLMAQRAGITPDAWQSDLLRSDAKQMILLCSRQAGKSTVTSIAGLHTALFQEGALVLLLSPSLRQSTELFRKLKDFYNAVASPSLPQIIEESNLRLELSNGSRVVALPGSEQTIRGYSAVDLLILDEAALVDDSLYQSVRPMLAVSGGKIILLSTPRGRRGFFYTVWANGGDAWQRTKITADQCVRIDKSWLERERAMIGDWWHRQEYGCEFLETSDSVFNFSDIEMAVSANVEPLIFEEIN
jgi:hypothetical protein